MNAQDFGTIRKQVYGRLIRRHRLINKSFDKKNKWTIEYLASKAQVDSGHVGKIENGKYLPGYETSGRLVEALGVDHNEFWEEYKREVRKYLSEDYI